MLNDRQRRFVVEYLVDLNATQAAVWAGYSPQSARTQAADLLTNPNIAAALAAAGLLLATAAPTWAGTTERVSVSSSGEQGNGIEGSSGASISADGRFVAFRTPPTWSRATPTASATCSSVTGSWGRPRG